MRLLDLKTEESSIRLKDVIRHDEPLVYTALSYCWGTFGNMETTRENLVVHQRGVELRKLPQTLLDAVKITLSLGMRYLWVDALCICQDDAHEKMQEIAEMEDIYAGATLTILASRSLHVQDGFLRSGSEEQSSGFELSVLCPDSQTGSVILQSSFSIRSMFLEPLARRAWTMQEHILSRRALAFCSQGVRWYCRSICTHEGLEPQKNVTLPFKDTPTYVDYSDTLSRDYESWGDFIHDFSACKITLSSDRLLALAGIAKRIQSTTHDGYLTGIWERSLPHGLMWYLTRRDWGDDFSNYVRPSPGIRASYRAQSWSWASLDSVNEISFFEQRFTYSDQPLKVMDVRIEPLLPEAPLWLCAICVTARSRFPATSTLDR